MFSFLSCLSLRVTRFGRGQQKSSRLNMMDYCAFLDGETRRGSDGN